MGKARLIRAAFLLTLLALMLRAGPSAGVDTDERSEWDRFNERCASDSLRTLTVPQADFRGCDADENQVNDFWTGDVRGLYTLPSERAK